MQVELEDFRFYRCSKKSAKRKESGKILDFPDVQKCGK